jgi:hypothetical protein
LVEVFERVYYDETGLPAMLAAKQSALRQSGRTYAAFSVAVSVAGALIITSNVIVAIFFLSWGVVGALMARNVLYKRVPRGPSMVTTRRIVGPGIRGGAIDVIDIRIAESWRVAPEAGRFLFRCFDGSKESIEAEALLNADAFWGAVVQVVANTGGWEWVGNQKLFRAARPDG